MKLSSRVPAGFATSSTPTNIACSVIIISALCIALSTLLARTRSDDGGGGGGGTPPPPPIVLNTNDSGPGSLDAAIANAPSGGTVTFAIPTTDPHYSAGVWTITLTTGELVIAGKNLTIQGPGANKLTVSGGGNSRVFFIGADRIVTLSGLTIAGGNGIGTDSRANDSRKTGAALIGSERAVGGIDGQHIAARIQGRTARDELVGQCWAAVVAQRGVDDSIDVERPHASIPDNVTVGAVADATRRGRVTYEVVIGGLRSRPNLVSPVSKVGVSRTR